MSQESGWLVSDGGGARGRRLLVRGRGAWLEGRRRLAGGGRRVVGGGRWGRAMALLLCLGLTAALARGCLHCHGNFSEKFSFYRHHVNLKSWWVGDIPVSGSLLTDWSQDTMKELHLAIPAEISEYPGPACTRSTPNQTLGQASLTTLLSPPAREKLNQVANAVYKRMDQLYQGKMYFPGKGAAATVGNRGTTPRPQGISR